MFALLGVVLTVALIVGFFYLVQVVSHIRNIMRLQIYWQINANIGDWNEKALKRLEAKGALDRWQRLELARKVGK